MGVEIWSWNLKLKFKTEEIGKLIGLKLKKFEGEICSWNLKVKKFEKEFEKSWFRNLELKKFNLKLKFEIEVEVEVPTWARKV